ncbi:regulatory protein GemA [Comamonas thiooxydans]|uniref:Regulatory protein GemA n=1 Tax=Comamonas thiooxydans TaxID=363952 RepID=A0AA42PX31_9BURK|nr:MULTISPECIES: regulatory protein GemA [Comamonas]MDH1333232.1 regulatory protein GemA [Comamonas thiooxydans]MDH1738995.1 regulatory protein GemA [Comamonas thiooxydans]MDH1786102.1 regulatory protein GemA [Comamonas thiooxydans]MPS95010.1 regulatory protein GemA [Comamonas sp.]
MTQYGPRRFTAHSSPTQEAALRRRELGHIHQGRSALGWSEDDYRFHLQNLTGKSSSADLDAAGRGKVLAHMSTLGFKPKATFKPFGQPEKIKWLWKKLDQAGGLRDSGDAALLAFVARTTGTSFSDLKFLPTAMASKVIEALKSMLDRAKATLRQ